MIITQNIIPKNRDNRPGFAMMPEYITIHDTANPNATAIAHGNYLAKNSITERLPTSWHFTVDDKDIVQHLPLNESGYHAGDGNGPGNRKSIGIEICEFTDTNKRGNAEKIAVQLTAYIANKLSIPLSKIVQHYYWTSKNCPRVLRSRPGGWDNFIKDVKIGMGKKDAPEWKVIGLRWLEENGLVTEGTWKAEDTIDMGTLGTILSRITITGRK
jgi:N-acetylmuramoyl-L-alanine amidase